MVKPKNIWLLLLVMGGLLLVIYQDRTFGAFPEDPPNDPDYDWAEETPPYTAWEQEQWYLFSFEPKGAPGAGVSGISADLAWKITIGRREVIAGVVDSGIDWYHNDLPNKFFLNRGELPEPRDQSGYATPGIYDVDGNGYFNIQDYRWDNRVRDWNKNGIIDPQDLIIRFSDGVDDDNNGFIDDISGWDFFENDNDIEDNTHYNGYSHGTGDAAVLIGAEGNNGIGKIGAGPETTLLCIRTSDSFVSDINRVGESIIYLVDMGAKLINLSLGTFSCSTFCQKAIDYATERGVVIISTNGDETSFHHMYPGAYNDVINISAITADTAGLGGLVKPKDFLCNNNLSNYGGHLHLSTPSVSGSDSTSISTGAASLIFARWLDITEHIKQPPLTANEVKQILCLTADDINKPPAEDEWPSQPGWDQVFGYGRLNIKKAVDLVGFFTIPPEARLTSPDWFEVLDPLKEQVIQIEGYVAANRAQSFDYQLCFGIGVEPLEYTEFFRSPALTQPVSGTLADLNLGIIPIDFKARPLHHDDFTFTLLLKVRDNLGNYGEDRRTLALHHDDDIKAGFPIKMPGSCETGVILEDINGDGVKEIIFGDSMGFVYIFDGKGNLLPGWPFKMETSIYISPQSGFPYGDSIPGCTVSGISCGDLDGDKVPEIVAGNACGSLYALKADGSVMPGFPVRLNPEFSRKQDRSFDNYNEMAILSTPVLEDIDRDGYLDIIVPACDQHLYIWDRYGNLLPGFPVHIVDPQVEKVVPRKIISTPAVADIDGDGFMEIVFGTGEVYGITARVYAYNHDGTLCDGWPYKPLNVYPELAPIIATGTSVSPVICNLGNSTELFVVIHTLFDQPSVVDKNGKQVVSMKSGEFGSKSVAKDKPSIAAPANYALADLDLDGHPDLMTSSVGARYAMTMLIPGKRHYFENHHSAWDLTTGDYLEYWPQINEDLSFFHNPIVADLDNDGYPEVLYSSGGYIVFAKNYQGKEPAGWPKFTGGWISSGMACGDVDGDELLEVVAVTKERNFYIWETVGRVEQNGKPSVIWQEFHGNPRKTGVMLFPTWTPTSTPTSTPTPTPTPTPIVEVPQILLAGYFNSRIDHLSGGNLNIIAYLSEPADLVGVFYQGQPSGLILNDAGINGDLVAGDGVYSLSLSLFPPLPQTWFCLDLCPRKQGVFKLSWPYLLCGD